MIYSLDGFAPDIHQDAWVADTAVLIGRVVLAEQADRKSVV